MTLTLNDLEVRVLGVLIEKSLTQPGSYPLTLNAITLGANQLQNRDPVVSYNEHEVSAAVRTLQHKKLAAQAPPSPSARANRFEHRAVESLHWDRRDQAIMAELMLRGRQTTGELRSRASRMTPFQDVESVMVTLQGLMSREPKWLEELPREPGRSANRFRHLLSADAGALPSVPEQRAESADAVAHAGARQADSMIDLQDPVAVLQQRVTRLESQVDSLSRLVDELSQKARRSIDRPDEPGV